MVLENNDRGEDTAGNDSGCEEKGWEGREMEKKKEGRESTLPASVLVKY